MADYSTTIANLQTAIETISAQMAEGRLTVKWSVGSETYESSKPDEAIERIANTIAVLERRQNRASRFFRVGKLGRALS